MPKRGNLDLGPGLGQTLTDLGKGEIRVGFDPGAQLGLNPRKAGAPIPADGQARTPPVLLPTIANSIDPNPAHFKPLRNRRRGVATLERPQYPISQIL